VGLKQHFTTSKESIMSTLDTRVQIAITALAQAISDSLYGKTNPHPTSMEEIYDSIDFLMVEDEVAAAIAKIYGISQS
jgi:hypothetical protein